MNADRESYRQNRRPDLARDNVILIRLGELVKQRLSRYPRPGKGLPIGIGHPLPCYLPSFAYAA